MCVGDDANGLRIEKIMPRGTGIIREPPDFWKSIPDYAEVNGSSADESFIGPFTAWFGSHIHAGGGVDTVKAGDGNDTIWGDGGGDYLYGDGGDDVIFGGHGDASIPGVDDNDIISGGSGNDTISGENGDDIIYGGVGADHMFGGAGLDTFTWHHVNESGISFPLYLDKIEDFNPTQDKIDLATVYTDRPAAASALTGMVFIGDWTQANIDDASFNHPGKGMVGFTQTGQEDFTIKVTLWSDIDPSMSILVHTDGIFGTPDLGWFHL